MKKYPLHKAVSNAITGKKTKGLLGIDDKRSNGIECKTMTNEFALKTGQFHPVVLSMDNPVTFLQDCESEVEQTFAELSEVIQKRKTAAGPVAENVERDICIEVRSLFIAFKTLSLVEGFDEALAIKVQSKLREALGVVTVEPHCISSIQNRLENEFGTFVKSMRPNLLDGTRETFRRSETMRSRSFQRR